MRIRRGGLKLHDLFLLDCRENERLILSRQYFSTFRLFCSPVSRRVRLWTAPPTLTLKAEICFSTSALVVMSEYLDLTRKQKASFDC